MSRSGTRPCAAFGMAHRRSRRHLVLRHGSSRAAAIGNPIRLLVGRFPTLSLAEARERARSLLRELQDGIDPRAAQGASSSGSKRPQAPASLTPSPSSSSSVMSPSAHRQRDRAAHPARVDRTMGRPADCRDHPRRRRQAWSTRSSIAAIREAARQTFAYARRLVPLGRCARCPDMRRPITSTPRI